MRLIIKLVIVAVFVAIPLFVIFGGDEAIDLLKQLKNGNSEQRLAALNGLKDIAIKKGKEAKDAIPELTAALADKSEDVRKLAAQTLGHLGSDASDAAPKLTEMLGDGSAEVRKHAVEALAKIGPEAAKAGPELKKLLTDEDESVRNAAAEAIKTLKIE